MNNVISHNLIFIDTFFKLNRWSPIKTENRKTRLNPTVVGLINNNLDIKIEFDEFGRKVWKVMDTEQKAEVGPPPAPEDGKDEDGRGKKYKRDTLKRRDYTLDVSKP